MIAPSTMISGPWLRPTALIDVGLRSWISGLAPGWPLVCAIRRPGTLPASVRIGSSDGTGSSSAVRRATANGTFTRSVPSIEPVTVTSFSRLMSRFSEKSCVWLPRRSVICASVGW